uniref:Uncharacterized protein n=1 Tax=Coturnix japonica TaxID=93934 RepID=A0A8C2T895_COTJA
IGSGTRYFHKSILKPLENLLPLKGTTTYCCGLQDKELLTGANPSVIPSWITRRTLTGTATRGQTPQRCQGLGWWQP